MGDSSIKEFIYVTHTSNHFMLDILLFHFMLDILLLNWYPIKEFQFSIIVLVVLINIVNR